jgi:hypothetical protein
MEELRKNCAALRVNWTNEVTSATKDVHARMAASVAARASAFAANIEAEICQLEIELPWLECLDAQATANSVLAGAV